MFLADFSGWCTLVNNLGGMFCLKKTDFGRRQHLEAGAPQALRKSPTGNKIHRKFAVLCNLLHVKTMS